MSEAKNTSTFMEELDLWIEDYVIGPIANLDPSHKAWDAVVEEVKEVVRQKVLETREEVRRRVIRLALTLHACILAGALLYLILCGWR